MVSVEEAEQIIRSTVKSFGTSPIPFREAIGRTLAEDLFADRDLPPYDRVTMDGIAICFDAYEAGLRSFDIKAIQAAGDNPSNISHPSECIEIMTGATLPETTDTVVRYEDLAIAEGRALIRNEKISRGQNVHRKGSDKKQNGIVAPANRRISPALLNVAAAVGKEMIPVKNNPKTIIISSGDELVDIGQQPSPYQVRRSNNYVMWAALKPYGLDAPMLHLNDDPAHIAGHLQHCLDEYDVLLLTGGISMGKFDHIPAVLNSLSVETLFHKVMQRPGKPFWFGRHSRGSLVFAFPGNPVSTFMCLHRYFIPWLERSSGCGEMPPLYAILDYDLVFDPALKYFLQVRLTTNGDGHVLARPVAGNGSGDFANLLDTNAFMELPAEKTIFKKGEVYRVWPF